MTEFKTLKRNRNQRAAEEFPISSHVLQIKVDEIRPNRAQPRAEFDQNSLIRLADSIRRYGIIQPLTIRRSDFEDIYPYELIAGERRLRAAKTLGYFTVPCIIVEADEKMSAEMAIIENLLREDLNMFEQAYGFKKLIDNHHLTQDEVAKRMSLSQSAVANKIRLLKLTYAEQQLILENNLTERHARALLKLESSEKRIEAIRHIAAASLNVMNTEQYIDGILARATKKEMQDDGFDSRKADTENLLALFRRKLEHINKSGRNATMEVTKRSKYLDVHIRIPNE